jgi:predicted metal-dependent phosphoesterase TrpH
LATPNNDPRLREVHLVGLFMYPEHDEFRARLADWCEERRVRAGKIIEKLNQIGIVVRPEEIFVRTGGSSISRLHVAQVIVRKRYAPTIGVAFRRWLGEGCPAFVPRIRPAAPELIALVHRAGGVVVLAHPGRRIKDEDLPVLVEAGIDGVEIYCPDHSWIDVNHYEETAKFYGLLISGGSDYHGHQTQESAFGSVRLEMAQVEALRQRAEKYGKGH